MVFLAGWGQNGRIMGNSLPILCTHCNNEKPHNVIEQNKKVTVFFVPVAKWEYKYYLLCPICSRGYDLKNKENALKIIADSFGGVRY